MAPLINYLGTPLGPDYTLTLDGKNISGQVRPRLLSLTVKLNRGITADSIDLELDDSDGKLELPTRGKTLLASIGWQGQPLALLGSFIVTAVKHMGAPDKVTISAGSADFRGKLDQSSGGHFYPAGNGDQTTLGEIVQTIAARNGLQPMLHPEMASIALIKQHQGEKTSDIAFLSDLALRSGAIVDVKYGRLLLLKPGSGTNASGTPLPPAIISRNQGDMHNFEITDRGISAGCRRNGWILRPLR